MKHALRGGGLAGLLTIVAVACGDSGATEPASATEVERYHDRGLYVFHDVTAESGLAAFAQVNGGPEKPFLVETVGGGCALFDHDQDGDLDVWLTNGGKLGQALADNPSDALFLNDGHGVFHDGSAAAGVEERRWTNGVRVCDVDGDGRLDVYLTNYGPNAFFVAVQGGRYRERAAECGIADERWSTGASFLDFDRDGDLDLHVSNYVEFDEERMLRERPTTSYQGVEVMKGPQGLRPAEDRFYVNEGGLAFAERTQVLGFHDEFFGFQSVVLDFDADGWLDLFVANDSVANNLWRNLRGERFEDV
ncbi:MAG: VCBS repeat-containing protein, partial [Planctomycetota bacterium]